MTIDLHTATAEELAEYVIGKLGWERHDGSYWARFPGINRYETTGTFSTDLNLIAAALPPGWDCYKVVDEIDGDGGLVITWIASHRTLGTAHVPATDSEPLDRLRLAALAWQAESKENEQ